MSGPIPIPGSRGSGQFGSNRVTPADGDTVALSQSVITIVSLPATPGAAVTLTAGSPATSPEFWAILRRDTFGFDTYALTFPGEYRDPEGLLAAGGSASAVVLHLVPDQYSDGTPVWATKIEPLEGGAVTFDDLESYAANTLATAEGYTDSAIGALGTAATKNVGTGSGDVAAGDAPAAALTAAEGYTDTAVAAAIAGRVDKAPVRLVATTNLSLTGSATIDGVAVVTGNRVLAAGQTSGAANGIYVANTAGAWTRSPDADTSAEMVNGLAVSIQEGTDHANQLWVLTTEGTIVLGTTVLVFSALSEQVQSVFGRKGAVAAQSGDYSVAQVTGAAPLASPTFTGTPVAPTAPAGTNTTQLASTAYVDAAAGLLIPKSVGTTKGDLAVFDGSAWQRLAASASDGRALMTDSALTLGVGYKRPAAVISATVVDTTVVSSVAETTLATHTVTGGTLVAGDLVRLLLWCDFLNNSGSNVTYRWKVKFGSTTVLDTGAASQGTASTRRNPYIVIEMIAQSGTAQSIRGHYDVGTTTSWAPVTSSNIGSGYGVAAEDTSTDKALAFTCQLGTSNAAADFVVHASCLELVKKR